MVSSRIIMKRTEIVDRLQAPGTGSVELDSQFTYSTKPVTADLLVTDVPAWGNVQDFINTSVGNIEIPFTDSLTIDWQNDMPAGSTENYGQLLGNNLPKYSIYSDNGDSTYDSNSIDVNVVKVSGLITFLTCNAPGNWILIL